MEGQVGSGGGVEAWQAEPDGRLEGQRPGHPSESLGCPWSRGEPFTEKGKEYERRAWTSCPWPGCVRAGRNPSVCLLHVDVLHFYYSSVCAVIVNILNNGILLEVRFPPSKGCFSLLCS